MSAGGASDDLNRNYCVARVVALTANRLAANVGAPAARSARHLAWTLPTRWWPGSLVAGMLLILVEVTLVSGTAKNWVILVGLRSFSHVASSPDSEISAWAARRPHL